MCKFYTVLVQAMAFTILIVPSFVYAADLKFVTLEVAPWAYMDEEQVKYVGIFPDLIEQFEVRTGHSIKVMLIPYARINRELETGRQDCTILVSEAEREKISVKGELVFNHPMGVIPKKSLKLKDYNGLYGMKISLLRGSTISDRFKNDKNLKKSFDTDYLISLRKVQHGRLDAIAGAIPTIQYLAKINDMTGLLGKPLELNSAPVYLQCSRKSKNLHYIDDLNKAIRSIKIDGTLQNILAKYS
ncbi:hypothetical protein AB835_01490 [Candidatus Endobugula sertula]|uniref:Solute-binding protein family 3/N-terminal domain-containing protein n=1 Tax=Candidatus Endobugula sertula TaxID=62101 RepID=A0A1D2QTU3_9GAMM|nr:hypothetical protein AB835_01490 [Candidatus Endobugula sertula]